MASPLSDIIPKVNDLSRNQNLSTERAIRAISMAVSYLKLILGMPGYERTYTFDFDDTQPTYSVPSDFESPISLRYSDDVLNRHKRFLFRPSEFLFERVKAISPSTTLWGYDISSGTWKLYVLAKNSTAGLLLDSMDSGNATNWTASNDAENISDDEFVYKEGSGSLKFNINTGLSGNNRATITRTFSNAFDLSDYEDIGHFKVWVYLPNITNLTSISLTWQSSSGNNRKQTVTAQANGDAFVADDWNELDFDWNGSTQTGSLDTGAVKTFILDIDYAASFTGGNNFRFDFLRLVVPDEMKMVYYTTYVGKNSGGAYISDFSASTDTPLFSGIDDNLSNLVAVMASVILNPQLLVDDGPVKALHKAYLASFMRQYPKKRTNNLLWDPKVVRTSSQR